MVPDYHTHTPLCRHAVGEPEAYARRAMDVGVTELGFSDHSPMPPDYDPDWRMEIGQYGLYVGMVERCRAAFPQLSIKLGLEADYHPGTEAFVERILKEHPFDYVIGSVHYLGDWGFDNPELVRRFEGRDIGALYEQYFGLVEALARTGLYDILGHPDLIKKFGHRPTSDWSALERRALEAVARAGMALDVNTSGLRRPAKEIYPRPAMLRAAREMGIGITFGSDAHEPGHVGQAFAEAIAHARAAGYTHYRRYTARRWESVPLPG
ncbi:MAG TPA: histidinol-phosphatase HisJ family protein [Planctomycetota bacterium]|nr:histidinol-phosphatase HisJ family protein [Planctomycetota bacterium]